MENISIIWLRLPDGWIPLERYDVNGTTPVYTPIVRPYSPVMTKKNFLGESVLPVTPPPHESPAQPHDHSILPRSAATPERTFSTRSRDPASRRDLHSRHALRGKYQASPTSISRAILKAKEDITALSICLRETSSEQARISSPMRYPQYAPSPNGKSTSSDRVVRLLAMQQQIDVLSSSILEIQESLSGVRQGLAAALAGDFNFIELLTFPR